MVALSVDEALVVASLVSFEVLLSSLATEFSLGVVAVLAGAVVSAIVETGGGRGYRLFGLVDVAHREGDAAAVVVDAGDDDADVLVDVDLAGGGKALLGHL